MHLRGSMLPTRLHSQGVALRQHDPWWLEPLYCVVLFSIHHTHTKDHRSNKTDPLRGKFSFPQHACSSCPQPHKSGERDPMSARLAYSLLGRSKYHILAGAPGGSARPAVASLGESQRGSPAGGGFSQPSALDEGGHLSGRRGVGESARRGGGQSARRGGGSTHAFKALPLLSPSASTFGGGGGGSGGGGLDHTVLKRIVEQEARLVEQAALIKRLEVKVWGLETSGHMPQKICEQLTEQEERSHTLMHSLEQKLEQTLTQQLQLQLQSALSIRAAAADVAAGGELHRSDDPSPLPPPPPRPPQRLETPVPRHRPSGQSPDASSSVSDCQDSRPRDDAGTSPHFATRKRKLSMLGQAADEGRAEHEAEQHDDDADDGWDVIPITRFSPLDPGLRGPLEGFIASGGGDGSSCSGGGGGLGLLGSFGGSGAVPNVFRRARVAPSASPASSGRGRVRLTEQLF